MTSALVPVRLLRRCDVEQRVGLRKSSLYELIERGRFPAPVRIGGRAVAWRSDDIDRWIESRQSARAGAAA